MNVADMQALLKAAKHFADAAQISQTASDKLSAVCDALTPFQSMEISAFASLLHQAEEYRRTGVLPVVATSSRVATKRSRSSSVESAKQIEPLVRQLQDLYSVVHEETVGFGAIDEICEAIGKLPVADVRAVAGAFDIKVTARTTKKQALEEIKRKLTEQKGSAQRILPIASL